MALIAGSDDTGLLYKLAEFDSYMQADIAEATAELNRDLATSAIRRAVGYRLWAAMTDDQRIDLKGVALDVAKRLTLNPESRRTEAIDDYSYTNATETFGGTGLSDEEEARVLAIFGIRRGAFSITPSAPTPYCAPRRRY
jgi:hypothetical protein